MPSINSYKPPPRYSGPVFFEAYCRTSKEELSAIQTDNWSVFSEYAQREMEDPRIIKIMLLIDAKQSRSIVLERSGNEWTETEEEFYTESEE